MSYITNIIFVKVLSSSSSPFKQSIYTYVPETNYVPRQYSVASVLLFLFMVHTSLAPVLNLLHFTLVLSAVYVQCPIWLFSVAP
jgi:hypothetical protein